MAASRCDVRGADIQEELREMTLRVPGVWTLDQLRDRLGGSGPDAQKGLFVERLRFALGCLVAGGEAERLGFDSYRIYPGNK